MPPHTNRRLRALLVVYQTPYFPGAGGVTYSYRLVQALSDVAEVTLVCAGETAEQVSAAQAAVAQYTVKCVAGRQAVPQQRSRHLPRRIAGVVNLAEVVLSGNPYRSFGQTNRTLHDTIRRILQTDRIDVVVVEYTDLATSLLPIVRAWGGPSIAFLHNVDSVYDRRLAQRPEETERHSLHLHRRVRIRALERVESAIAATYSVVSLVSGVDSEYMARRNPTATITTTHHGMDLDYLTEFPRKPVTPPRLIFTGSLWYQPNIDGLRLWFRDIWPVIHEKRPDVECVIVGNSPVAEVLAMADQPGVTLHASVPDMRPYLAQSAMLVAPLRLGSGARVKIIEALGTGCPVVSTTLGAEGLRLLPGRDILLADTPTEFATAVLSLLDDPPRAAELAENGHRMVRRLYNTQLIRQDIGHLIGTLVRRG